MRTFLLDLWTEIRRAARQAPRMYFAPFVGAVRHSRVVLRQVVRENSARKTP